VRVSVHLLDGRATGEGGHVAQAGEQVADFALESADLGVGVIHVDLDVVIQVLVAHVAQGIFPVDLVRLGGAHDVAGNDDTDFADAGDIRVKQATFDFLGGQGLGEGFTGGVDHVVGDADGLGQDAAQADAGEHVHVVTLAGVVRVGLALGVGEGHGGEGRAGGEETAAISVLDGGLEVALGLGGGVRQREDDGGCVPVGHLAEDLGGEDTAHGGQTHQDGRLDMVDDLLEGLELLAVIVLTGKVDLVVGELVTTISGDETLGVDEVEAVASILLGHALADEEINDLLGNTDTGRASAEEDSTLILAGETGTLDSVDDTTENDGAGTLDVIVKAGVGTLVTLKCGEGVLEVLELDHNAKLNFPLACVCTSDVADPPHPGCTRGAPGLTRELTYPGQRSVRADINSSKNSRSSSGLILSRRLPMYSGSSRRVLLLVPRSRVNGRVASGRIPAQAVYRANLPMGIPMPLMPRSPSPRIREPSVIHVISTVGWGQLAITAARFPRSSQLRYIPNTVLVAPVYLRAEHSTYPQVAGRSRTSAGRPRQLPGCRSRASAPAGSSLARVINFVGWPWPITAGVCVPSDDR